MDLQFGEQLIEIMRIFKDGNDEPLDGSEFNNFNGIEPNRQLAIDIIDTFETILDEHDITIPDEDREGLPEEARIYGMTYANLEDSIIDLIRNR